MSDWRSNLTEKAPRRPFSAAVRRENVERLARDKFDLLIIGGGITGAAVARDAALRGIRTALVERDDFGSGTSSRSSRLIHGGIRYLEYYQFKLVFEACSERCVMRQIAPRLVRPLPFLYPLYLGQKPAPWKLRMGLMLYDVLGLFRNVQRHRWLRPPEVREREPMVAGRGLLGAARFYDAQTDDARLTLITVKAAHRHGAVVVNHAPAVDLMKARGRIVGVVIRDEIDGREIETHARVVINATGVWGDHLRRMDSAYEGTMIRPTKGAHLVIPRERLRSRHAVVFDSPRDGRHVFLIPWGDFALIGTTDTDYAQGDLSNPAAGMQDVAYLLEAMQHAFPGAQLSEQDVISTFAGLRPLIFAPGGTYALSREHAITESPAGLITVAGGKLTTHRLMGEQLTDLAQARLAEDFGADFSAESARSECRTRTPLDGAQMERTPIKYVAGLDYHTDEHLSEVYGGDAAWIQAYVEENPALGKPIAAGRPYLMAEALYAVQHEMALTLCDVLIRRTHVLHETRDGGLDNASAVVEVMAPRLGWDEAEIECQMADYAKQVNLAQQWRG